ncbi:hypothetical protein PIB30_070534 [Stylosanthes scabra]|uniref:SAWADEE domain-containing protein n=1 Tax=Stylosanthes scabra TaxID=79078 RepID=A0ABU6TQ18_9FABA|nr:hypothetical protein [Stylosanthes scabra]
MPPDNNLSLVSQPDYNTEFRSFKDEAWYSVAISLEDHNQLRIKYLNFSVDHDEVFEASDFKTQQELDQFIERFRPLSKQLQDYECHQLRQGVRVCACHRFRDDDVRFYDAEVDSEYLRETLKVFLIRVVRAASFTVWYCGVMDQYSNVVKELKDGELIVCSMWRLPLEGKNVEVQV